jgi:hypothetical protein
LAAQVVAKIGDSDLSAQNGGIGGIGNFDEEVAGDLRGGRDKGGEKREEHSRDKVLMHAERTLLS